MSQTVLVTGCGGLIGSEATEFYLCRGWKVVGIDNDMRAHFFGHEASTKQTVQRLVDRKGFRYYHADIQDRVIIEGITERHRPNLVIHTAAQPSHDWAVKDPHTDFGVNAVGTLNLLEATRKFAPEATFIHCSTSKVYGDTPNRLPLARRGDRFDLLPGEPYYDGIDTTMSIDQCLHSLFGASKASADLLVQEYGRYFGMNTVCFRPGCLTGPAHAGAELHGFLSYMMRCAITGKLYTVFGYDGLQVRCNIHSYDLVGAFDAFHSDPRAGAVYNIGGGRENSCSMWEALDLCACIANRTIDWTYKDENRIGDHKWWISSNADFELDYPNWRQSYTLDGILSEIHQYNAERWTA